MPFIVIAEFIPAQDEARVYATLQRDFPGTRLLGPNCPGLISAGKANIGITSGDIALAGDPVEVMSGSGRSSTRRSTNSSRGIGQTTGVGIGGDPVPGTNFIDCLKPLEEGPRDPRRAHDR